MAFILDKLDEVRWQYLDKKLCFVISSNLAFNLFSHCSCQLKHKESQLQLPICFSSCPMVSVSTQPCTGKGGQTNTNCLTNLIFRQGGKGGQSNTQRDPSYANPIIFTYSSFKVKFIGQDMAFFRNTLDQVRYGLHVTLKLKT